MDRYNECIMSKILLLAQGDHIAGYAEEVRRELTDPDEMSIAVASMEEAVRIARERVDTDTEVLNARGTTADLLRESNIPIPVVDIPINDDDISDSLKSARQLAGDDATIGFIGFRHVIVPVRSFLETLNVRIKLYEIHSGSEFPEQIERARRDGVSVIIGGVFAAELIEKAGLRAVRMDSSVASIRQAYKQARSALAAIAIEKKKHQESQTILNSVTEAIISMDRNGRLLALNRIAAQVFDISPGDLDDNGMERLFTPGERRDIARAIDTGEEAVGAIIERQGHKYAMRATPVLVDGTVHGVVVTLQAIDALIHMEATVRKGLYRKGNVARYVFDDIKGVSPELQEAVNMARRFSGLQSNVLIIGDTGTGKEMFAQSIHNASARRHRPFVAVNCGAIPANLIESELFGYDEGAFSGAKKGGRPGLFELAHGGTLFLDEISEMEPAGQVTLLRSLQEQQIRRVGGHDVIPVDVRVIAACNVNLYDMVQGGTFRKDLYYRLSVLVVRVPPLCRRPDDITVLSTAFLSHYNGLFDKNVALSEAAFHELEQFFWDGNVRQLKNFCERVVALADSGEVDAAFIRRELHNSYWTDKRDDTQLNASPRNMSMAPTGEDAPLVIKGKVFSRAQLSNILSAHVGNKEAVANELGISRTTLWKQLKKHGLA